MRLKSLVGIVLITLMLGACSVMPPKSFPREHDVNLDRYMGKWYVIAHIPPGTTADSYNAIERYTQTAPHRIQTVFTYRDGGFKGGKQTMKPTGSVIDDSGNAVWAMRFYHILRMQYVISYVDSDYQTTIVARDKRDYVWIMARKPQIDDATYNDLVARVKALGYDVSKLRKVPQQPLSERGDG